MAPSKFVLAASIQVHTLYDKFLQRRKAKGLVADPNWLMIVIVSVMILLLASFIKNSSPVQAKSNVSTTPAYACGDVSSNHCYGANRWMGPMYGASTEVGVVQLHAGDGIMNNSLWVGNKTHTQWLEAGYAVITSKNYEFWYFGYINNNGTYKEMDDPYGLVSGSAGDFASPATIYIKNVSGNVWNAAVYGSASRWLPDAVSLTNFAPDAIDVGEELGGSSGASAPVTTFYYNEWRNASGNYVYQTATGTPTSENPPYANWTVFPSNSSTGGVWHAST
jgi:hypothetical protein